MAPVAVTNDSTLVPTAKQVASSSAVEAAGDTAFVEASHPYQRRLKLTESNPNEPEVTFPLILKPTHASDLTTSQLVEAVKPLAPTPSSSYTLSPLQQLMDAHGGAVHFKSLPIRTADDFSRFMHALAGNASSPNTWQYHVDKGLMVIRHAMAPNVATANEGPPHQSIGSHNEYGLSTHYPSVIAFCCLSPPDTGGQTPIVNSIALYDRLKATVPTYVEKIQRRGLTFVIHHPVAKVKDSVQGNSLYNADSFGPTPDEKVDLDSLSEEQKRALVEEHILDLAREGGWGSPDDGQQGGKLGAWHERGFSWTWLPDGSINVFQRVPGIRIHPTLGKPAYFNNVGNRYSYSKEHGCLQPPHYSEVKKDFFPPPSFPLPLEDESGAEDEPIPLDEMEEALRWTEKLQAHVEWELGDVLVIDNLAVQHARTPWTGPRKLVASLWDQPSYLAKHAPVRT
ncbi:Taurine catabolism dioxygenase TauD/TfdA [Kalmanozyma brasiliensis GHG001]|uniref:TauD/TfdA-like domain-containing protein n=1 Tax=Kalmanozyma brasiliensis (strain GHG001) TaxID=1365824 RepID=V5ESQ0_KALBG|nr:Taurine catabolism dioxygenase TauD/TfdA [Kalmanozyma brasiliensis GHG001]EST05998.1 Taurine catabolism dioxygenase TauD/TfdA [Kalmanozyma brasiliensis GHG001]